MELLLGEKGHPSSALVAALVGRRLSLDGGKPGGAHPVQSIHAVWRVFSSSLLSFAVELEAVQFATKPDGDRVTDAFRRIIYDATEVFDVYSQLLVERIGPFPSSDKKRLKDYQVAAKRLRDPWAIICNKCKHSGAHVGFVWAVSETTGRASPRFMICSYRNGDSLVRDDEVHKGRRGGTSLAKAALEMLHALLRVDIQAAKFVGLLVDKQAEAIPEMSAELPIGEGLRKLVAIPATAYPDEPTPFDGLRVEEGKILLTRTFAERLLAPIKISTTLPGDGVTKTFSFE
ncbi:hypothetical protein [Mesorhizobium sp. 128a]